MTLYPAIDLMGGQAVRLYQGDKNRVTVYGDPVRIALTYRMYTERLHIVDLDGAFCGKPVNLKTMEKIIAETGMHVQIGGGFRDYESVKAAYGFGAAHVIVGTKAFDFRFLQKITDEFEGITVSLDLKKGELMTSGWQNSEKAGLYQRFYLFRKYTHRFIYTDIEKDGTLGGVAGVERFWGDSEMIYAAGVRNAEDIEGLAGMGFSGVIIGKALLDGAVTLADLQGR